MRIIIVVCSVLCLFLSGTTRADEGFFKPSLMYGVEQQQWLSIAKLGPCSATLISPNGLFITSLRCLRQQVASSRIQRVLKQGFSAQTKAQELPLYLAQAMVLPLSYQLNNQLNTSLDIHDLRLVFVPSAPLQSQPDDSEIMTVERWPAHRADFVLVRAYVDPNGGTRGFSTANVPMQTQHYIKLVEHSVSVNDALALLAYPSQSRRHEPRDAAEYYFNRALPREALMLSKWRNLIDQAVTGKEQNIKPEAFEYYTNQSRQLLAHQALVTDKIKQAQRSGVVPPLWAKAPQLKSLASADPLQLLIRQHQKLQDQQYWLDVVSRSTVLSASIDLYSYAWAQHHQQQGQASAQEVNALTREQMQQRLLHLNNNYDAEVDAAVWRGLVAFYAEQSAAVLSPLVENILAIPRLSSSQISALETLNSHYFNSAMHDVDYRIRVFTSSLSELEQNTDPMLILAKHLFNERLRLQRALSISAAELSRQLLQFAQLKSELAQSKRELWYPEATGDLRISLGQVAGSEAEDGLLNLPFTYLTENQQEFLVSQETKLMSHFLTNHDATTGSVGGAVLNQDGDMVGMLVDGTGASINSLWYYDARFSRAVNLHTGFILKILAQSENAKLVYNEVTSNKR